jgi:L-lactate dehydrogenase (cytochrome)
VTSHRVPRWSELRSVLQIERPRVSTSHKLGRAATIDDLRAQARRRTPRAVFDYVDGAAESEISLRRAREAFESVEFRPRVLRDVSNVSTATTILGRPAMMPVALAPTGFTRMMHHEGELAVGRAAASAGIPYALSTMGTTSIEALAAAVAGPLWFQLYVWRDRERTKDLIARAAEHGYEALVLTVDVPVAGARLRDVRNGMTIPPTLTWRTLAGGTLKPRWWMNFLTTEPLEFASLSGGRSDSLADIINTMFDPAVELADVEWLRSEWPGSLAVKGVQTVEDARQIADLGVDAIVVSNHGGRQLDRATTPLEILPRVVDAVGDRVEVMLDTGVRSGADVAAAVALGARACLVGRAYLYGLMAGGQAGVGRAIAILHTELVRTLQLLGVSRVQDLDRSCAALRNTSSP